MADFGGEMRLTVPSIGPVTMRGTFSIDPSRYDISSIVNVDNSVSRQMKPSAYGADLKSLEDSLPGNASWDQVMTAPVQDMRIVEEQSGVVHILGGAFFEGAPMVDRETGEVTGIKIKARSYRKVNG